MPINTSLIAEIAHKESKHAVLQQQSFVTLNFGEKIKIFKLKAELGNLCLEAAQQASAENERQLKGHYLRKVLKYNPFVKPELVDDPRLEHLDYSELGYLLPQKSTMKDASVETLGTFIAVGVFGIPAFLFGPAVNYTYTYGVEKKLQQRYVKNYCLGNINETAENCLSIAVAILDSGIKHENLLAMRYLLEAELCSEEHNPEIAHYLSRCFENLRFVFTHMDRMKTTFDFRNYETPFRVNLCDFSANKNAQYSLAVSPDEELLWPLLFEIKKKVLESHTQKPRENKMLNFIWELPEPAPKNLTAENLLLLYQNTSALRDNFFHNLLVGKLGFEDVGYQVTLAELSQFLRQKLYAIEGMQPTDIDFDDKVLPLEGVDKSLKNTSLAQLVVYMSQVTEIPEDYIKAALTNCLLQNDTTVDNSEAEIYLYD